jgi:hypothetical protein
MEPDENKPDELSPVDLLKTWSSISAASGSISAALSTDGDSSITYVDPVELSQLIKNLSDSYLYYTTETDKSSEEYKELEKRLEQLKAGIECLNTTVAHYNVKIEEMRYEALALESEMDVLPMEVKKNYIKFFSEETVKKFSEDSLVIKLEKALLNYLHGKSKPLKDISIIMNPDTCYKLSLELKHFSPELLSVSFNATGIRNFSFKGVPIIRSDDVNKDIFIIK